MSGDQDIFSRPGDHLCFRAAREAESIPGRNNAHSQSQRVSAANLFHLKKDNPDEGRRGRFVRVMVGNACLVFGYSDELQCIVSGHDQRVMLAFDEVDVIGYEHI